ncbi:MAG TPA: imelysin family protein [Bdellovibrionota bacterium]|jgi:putative iron-regulated protein
MKKTLTLTLMALIPLLAAADAPSTTQQAVKAYVQAASAQYIAAVKGANDFQRLVGAFLATPNAQTLRAARNQWIEMRKSYSPSEIYRFYGGPIDGDNGPEGMINSWPLDEAYIDYVVGAGNSGLINDLTHYPSITKEVLRDLNEKGGEKNISVGYHAIEFLLWGQDLSSTGPGNRLFTDYVVGKGKNADRRREYLRLATQMLVEDLSQVAAQWDMSRESSYANTFVKEEQTESLRKMLTGIYRMAGEELSQERMFVAYDTQSQEDEHSCFSDTTHLDLRYNFQGIVNVLEGVRGPGMIALVREKDAALADSLAAKMGEANKRISSIPGPFDNAIYSEAGRAAILASVHALEDLALEIKKSAAALGVEIN